MAAEPLTTEERSFHFRPPAWQQRAWDTLLTALRQGRLSQALLITGPLGVGKRAFAESLMALLFCESGVEQGGACGSCNRCQQLAAGSHPDYSLLAPLPEKRWINIEQIRAFGDRLRLTAQYSGGRVGLIDPADALQPQAANALLKTLEEPAAGNHLILLSQRPAQLLPTIRSRCQLLNLPLPDEQAAAGWLAENDDISASALALAGSAPFEALRRQRDGVAEHYSSWFGDFLKFLRGRGDAMALAARWRDTPQAELMAFLGLICCDILRLKHGVEAARARTDTQLAALRAALPTVDSDKLAENLRHILRARRLQESNADKQLVLEELLIRLADCRIKRPT